MNPRFLAPFTSADLMPLPNRRAYTDAGPAFVGVGTPKSGTSWVSHIIFSHPDVAENRLGQKELHYFSHFPYKTMDNGDISTYRAAFICREDKITGEFTPSYYWYPFALQHLHKAAPEAKIIMVVRNPIDRMLSHMNQIAAVRGRMLNLDGDAFKIYRFTSVIPEVMSASLYSRPLELIYRYYDQTKVLVLQYEKLVEDAASQIRNIYKFLGLTEYSPENASESINRRPYIVERFSEEERDNLTHYFLDDVAALAERGLVDINLWQEFKRLL